MSASRYFDEKFATMCIPAGIWLPSVKFDMALASPNCSDDMEKTWRRVRPINFDTV
jgi:hypothetical protein